MVSKQETYSDLEETEMHITRIGSDYITIDEDNINDKKLLEIPRVHIIKLFFIDPTKEKILKTLKNFPRTNRFVIEDNIRTYNYVLRNSSKKYYVENTKGDGLITFFRRNNKVLINVNRLSPFERQFLLQVCLVDMLRNIEVIYLEQEDYDENKVIFDSWNGNVIIGSD